MLIFKLIRGYIGFIINKNKMSDIDDGTLNIFFGLNTFVFVFYTSLATFVLTKLHFTLDNVSLVSMAAAFISFLIRFINWMVFKIRGFDTQVNVQ